MCLCFLATSITLLQFEYVCYAISVPDLSVMMFTVMHDLRPQCATLTNELLYTLLAILFFFGHMPLILLYSHFSTFTLKSPRLWGPCMDSIWVTCWTELGGFWLDFCLPMFGERKWERCIVGITLEFYNTERKRKVDRLKIAPGAQLSFELGVRIQGAVGGREKNMYSLLLLRWNRKACVKVGRKKQICSRVARVEHELSIQQTALLKPQVLSNVSWQCSQWGCVCSMR